MEYAVYNYVGGNIPFNKEEFYTFDETVDNIILKQDEDRLYLVIYEVKSKSSLFIPFALNRFEEKINREDLVFAVLGRIKRECYKNSELDNILKNLRLQLGEKYGKI